MKYTEAYKVKWHDTDSYRRVRPSGHLVYMQETANLQIQNAGRSLDDIRDAQGLAFILSKIKLVFEEPLYAYDEIKVNTWTCESRGYSFLRCFEIFKGSKSITRASSVWALLDLESKKLVRSDEFSLGVENDDPLDIEMPRRIKPAASELRVLGQRTIRYSDIDYNLHMNNTRYPDMLCDFMPMDKISGIREMTLEFLHESALGDTLTFYGAEDGGRYYFRTVNSAGDVCLAAEIITK